MTTQNEHVEQALTSFIDQSWHRCGKMMKREFWSTPHQAKGLTFQSICRRKTALLTIGQAALEDAWSIWTVARAPCLFWMSLLVF
jgi:transcriptional activator for dhaKLM operon